jgi:PTH1 family peptidyl-tRNA hydrolase
MGFMVVEEFASSQGWSWQEDRKLNAKLAKGVVNNRAVDLILPLTYMNLSGSSVRQYLDYYKMSPSQIVVICDDTALPFGQLRVRSEGSSGGHNGLKSLIGSLGTQQFIRLRMGVGGAMPGQDLADYVLNGFNADEKASLGDFIKRGAKVLTKLTIETVTQVMNDIKLCRPEK